MLSSIVRNTPVMHRAQVGELGHGELGGGEVGGGEVGGGEPPGTEPGSWRPDGHAGTLLAVVPVAGGSARMAVVGYLLPRSPGPADPARLASPGRPVSALHPATPARPASAASSARPVTAIRSGWAFPAPVVNHAPAARAADASALAAAAAAELPAVGLLIDVAGRRVLVDGRDVGLVYLEFELLRFLAANAGRALSRDDIFRSVWGEEPLEASRTVDIHVHRIRRKLGAEHSGNLVTVRRIGYRYERPFAG